MSTEIEINNKLINVSILNALKRRQITLISSVEDVFISGLPDGMVSDKKINSILRKEFIALFNRMLGIHGFYGIRFVDRNQHLIDSVSFEKDNYIYLVSKGGKRKFLLDNLDIESFLELLENLTAFSPKYKGYSEIETFRSSLIDTKFENIIEKSGLFSMLDKFTKYFNFVINAGNLNLTINDLDFSFTPEYIRVRFKEGHITRPYFLPYNFQSIELIDKYLSDCLDYSVCKSNTKPTANFNIGVESNVSDIITMVQSLKDLLNKVEPKNINYPGIEEDFTELRILIKNHLNSIKEI